MKRQPQRVLVIAPHMDDEVLGCGGTVVRHLEAGAQVSVVVVADRAYDHVVDERSDREKEHARKARKVLGYGDLRFLGFHDERLYGELQGMIAALEERVVALEPDTVYVPFRGDNNQDHRSVFDAARVALRPSATPFIRKVLMYEVPSSTEQSPPLPECAFLPNAHSDIGRALKTKLKALRCYGTESRPYPHPRSERAVEILARKRGIEAGLDAAEAFVILRERWLG